MKFSVKQHIEPGENTLTQSVIHFLVPLLLLVSIARTVINPFSAFCIDLHVGQINPGIFGAALTTQCSGLSDASIPWSGAILHSLLALQCSSLSSELSRSPFDRNQFSVSEMLSGALNSSLSTGWLSIRLIQKTFNIWVWPPGRSFADKAGGKGDLSDNVNAAAPSYWKFDQNALMISSASEMYPMAVNCLIWAQNSFCVARRFWQPCHISKRSCTLAILCNFHSSASFFNLKSVSISVLSNAVQLPANILQLAPANCLTMTFSWSVLPVVLDCLLPTTSRPREKLASTMTECGLMETMSRATLKRSEYFECVSSCSCHQSVISGNQNVLLTSMGSEW